MTLEHTYIIKRNIMFEQPGQNVQVYQGEISNTKGQDMDCWVKYKTYVELQREAMETRNLLYKFIHTIATSGGKGEVDLRYDIRANIRTVLNQLKLDIEWYELYELTSKLEDLGVTFLDVEE